MLRWPRGKRLLRRKRRIKIYNDRREFRRQKILGLFKFQICDDFDKDKETWLLVNLVDLSVGGLKLITDRKIISNKMLYFKIYFLDGGSHVCGCGRIVWRAKRLLNSKKYYYVGLKFTDLDKSSNEIIFNKIKNSFTPLKRTRKHQIA